MAATVINFFNPADIFALESDGWIVQEDPFTNAESAEEVVGLAADGNYLANSIFNKLKEATVVYKNFGASPAVATLLPLGTVVSGVLLKGFSVEFTPKDFPTMNAQAFKSVTGATVTQGRTYTPTVALPLGRGVPRALVDTTPTTPGDVFKMGTDDAGIGMLGMTYTIAAEYITPDTAEFTAGEFCNAYEELVIRLSGVPASVTLGTGWEYVGKGGARGNKTAEGYEFTIRKRIAAEDSES